MIGKRVVLRLNGFWAPGPMEIVKKYAKQGKEHVMRAWGRKLPLLQTV